MAIPPTTTVGREQELAALSRFVADIDDGPASLVLEGIAGIGKTSIWASSVSQARARGIEVRTCRCSQSDAGWAFAGLGDLLDGLGEDILTGLPAVQRQALSAALLLSDVADSSPGSRVVGVAVLGVLRALGRRGPLLIAVDDVQWLDLSSRNVLSFALRRLDDEPVRLISACRTGTAADSAPEADLGLPGTRIALGPVSIGVLQRIIHAQLGQALSRQTLARLHQATGGSPMMCLEMARALQRRGRELVAGEPLPVPADLRALVTDRLRGLSEGARALLLFVGALAQPTLSAVADAVGDRDECSRSLSEAVRAGVLELDGERIHFTHPLIASIPYADLTADLRCALHQRLAATVADPEEHARHSALGSLARSSTVATTLDIAARHARGRGSVDAAAELAELAVARTPSADVDELLRRTVIAAHYHLLLGEPITARRVLGEGLDAAAPGPARVPGLLLQASIASWESGDATVAAFCEQALTEAADDPLLLARAHATYAETCPSGAALDLWHAHRAVELLETLDSPPSDLLANALSNVASHGLRLGRGLAVSTLERAEALQALGQPLPVSDRAGMALGMYLKVVDRFDESRTWLQRMRTCAADEGDDSSLPITLGHLATLECWSGDYDLALRYAAEGVEHVRRMGVRSPMPASAQVLAMAHQGRLEEARALGERDVSTDEALGYRSAVALHLRSLGFVELLAGHPALAAEHLLTALSISSDEVGIGEPGILRLHGDAVAALVDLRRLDEAERLTGMLDVSAAANRHPWSTSTAGRCHALLQVAKGSLDSALEFLEEALVAHERLPMPVEQARTRLLFGAVLRRSGHRNDARRELEAALATFSTFGTPVLLEQARAELASVGGRRNTVGRLTPVEQRVTALVVAGRANKEVALSLFMSVRTVEGHLGRIYQKLGVRSRTELAVLSARQFADGTSP